MTTDTLTAKAENSYDEVPYESYPYSQSHPRHLKTVATFFGVNATPLEKAKVLELGCASGGNIIPFASEFPKSECVGIDLSEVQIKDGQKIVDHLGLKNLKLLNKSIIDIDESFGKFDYIIVHGVFSWVPEEVREKIFEISKRNLSPSGLVYISYNTLPGWNMVRSIRDMLLYHCSNFADPKEKVSQARFLLQFMNESVKDSGDAYSKFLEKEVNLLLNHSDHYILHDHMEENNYQIYFHEFVEKAREKGLRYLGDSHIQSMFLSNLPEKAAKKLSEITKIVKAEQYMDFVTNRRFRSTILCHENVAVERNLSKDNIEKFYINFNIKTDESLTEDQVLDPNYNATFYYLNKDQTLKTSSPYSKAVFLTLTENNGKYMKFSDIIATTLKKYNKLNKASLKANFVDISFNLLLKGILKISSEKIEFVTKISEKPEISSLVKSQIQNRDSLWITNFKHEIINISLFEKIALTYLDGKTDKENLVPKVVSHIKSNNITAYKNNEPIEDDDSLKLEISKMLDRLFEKLPQMAILV